MPATKRKMCSKVSQEEHLFAKTMEKMSELYESVAADFHVINKALATGNYLVAKEHAPHVAAKQAAATELLVIYQSHLDECFNGDFDEEEMNMYVKIDDVHTDTYIASQKVEMLMDFVAASEGNN
jgi:hypothetical protein